MTNFCFTNRNFWIMFNFTTFFKYSLSFVFTKSIQKSLGYTCTTVHSRHQRCRTAPKPILSIPKPAFVSQHAKQKENRITHAGEIEKQNEKKKKKKPQPVHCSKPEHCTASSREFTYVGNPEPQRHSSKPVGGPEKDKKDREKEIRHSCTRGSKEKEMRRPANDCSSGSESGRRENKAKKPASGSRGRARTRQDKISSPLVFGLLLLVLEFTKIDVRILYSSPLLQQPRELDYTGGVLSTATTSFSPQCSRGKSRRG